MTCHMVSMITNVQMSGGPNPKNLGGQNLKIWRDFCTTFELDCECLKNQVRYQKLGTNLIEGNRWGFSKKFSELWSTNEKVIGVDVDLP